MAKCIQHAKTKEVRRVSDDEAAKLTDNGWVYISKSQYKRLMEKAVAA